MVHEEKALVMDSLKTDSLKDYLNVPWKELEMVNPMEQKMELD